MASRTRPDKSGNLAVLLVPNVRGLPVNWPAAMLETLMRARRCLRSHQAALSSPFAPNLLLLH